jgi:hypothetical protein
MHKTRLELSFEIVQKRHNTADFLLWAKSHLLAVYLLVKRKQAQDDNDWAAILNVEHGFPQYLCTQILQLNRGIILHLYVVGKWRLLVSHRDVTISDQSHSVD